MVSYRYGMEAQDGLILIWNGGTRWSHTDMEWRHKVVSYQYGMEAQGGLIPIWNGGTRWSHTDMEWRSILLFLLMKRLNLPLGCAWS